MKQTIASLFLVAGVIVAALAAGESQRVSQAAPIDDELVGQVLHTKVATENELEHPDVIVYHDRAIPAGTTLDADHVAWLRTLDLDEVLILRRIADDETLPVGPEALGRVLASKVVLAAEDEEISPGRMITAEFEERLRATDLEQVKVTAKRKLEDGSTEREEVVWPLGEEAVEPEGLTLAGSNLGETITIPIQLKVSSYVDDDLLARLQASEINEVSVKIPKVWTIDGWQDRWRFLIGIGLTVVGLVMKRSKPGADEAEAGQMELAQVSGELVRLEGEVERLVQRAKDMDPAALHAAIDPLLTGPVYTIAEGRNSIRQAHGSRVFTAVMDAFARGERKLNRAWSAAVDDHAEESRASLSAALPALREAREALPGTQPPAPAGFGDEHPHKIPMPPDVPLASGEGHWADEES